MAAAGELAMAFLQQQLQILIRNVQWHHGCQTCPHHWNTRDVSQIQNVKSSTLVVASHLWCIISLISLIFCLTVWVITGLRRLLKTDVMMSTTVTGEISRWSPSLLIHDAHWGEHVFNMFFFFLICFGPFIIHSQTVMCVHAWVQGCPCVIEEWDGASEMYH